MYWHDIPEEFKKHPAEWVGAAACAACGLAIADWIREIGEEELRRKPKPKPPAADPAHDEICHMLEQAFLNALGRNDFAAAEAIKLALRLNGCDDFFDDDLPDPMPTEPIRQPLPVGASR